MRGPGVGWRGERGDPNLAVWGRVRLFFWELVLVPFWDYLGSRNRYVLYHFYYMFVDTVLLLIVD